MAVGAQDRAGRWSPGSGSKSMAASGGALWISPKMGIRQTLRAYHVVPVGNSFRAARRVLVRARPPRGWAASGFSLWGAAASTGTG
jgi:hypothetical protein